MMGAEVRPVPASLLDPDYVAVKAPQFSFSRIKEGTRRCVWRWRPQ